jgi:hypothetical protein
MSLSRERQLQSIYCFENALPQQIALLHPPLQIASRQSLHFLSSVSKQLSTMRVAAVFLLAIIVASVVCEPEDPVETEHKVPCIGFVRDLNPSDAYDGRARGCLHSVIFLQMMYFTDV